MSPVRDSFFKSGGVDSSPCKAALGRTRQYNEKVKNLFPLNLIPKGFLDESTTLRRRFRHLTKNRSKSM